jgi:hypothetical protein
LTGRGDCPERINAAKGYVEVAVGRNVLTRVADDTANQPQAMYQEISERNR